MPFFTEGLSYPLLRHQAASKALGLCQGPFESGRSRLFWSQELCVTLEEWQVCRQRPTSTSVPEESGDGQAPAGGLCVGGSQCSTPPQLSLAWGHGENAREGGGRGSR